MKKYPVYIQDEEMACGAYCILMILKYYGYKEEIKTIKKKARLSRNGISIKGMIECLKEYQIESKAYHASLDDIKEQVVLPCVLHLIKDDITHYVVLYEIKDDRYIIGDSAIGLVTMYKEELEEIYSQNVISIIHVGRVPSLYYQSYLAFLKTLFLSYKKYMYKLISKGFLIALYTYLASYFYQIFLDYIHKDTHYFYMALICMTYGIIQIINVRLSHIKNNETIRLLKAIDEDIVFDSSMNLFSHSYSLHNQEKGQIQSQLISFYELSQLSIDLFSRVFLDGTMMIVLFIGMIFISEILSFIVMMMYIIIIILSVYYFDRIKKAHKHYLEASYQYQHHLLELIENQFLIQRYLLNKKIRHRSYEIFSKSADHKEKQSLQINDYTHINQYIIYVFYMIIMLLGFYLFKKEMISLGQIFMFYMLVSYSMDPLMSVIDVLLGYKQTSLIYEKYKSFETDEKENKNDITEKITSITLDNVGYSYGYIQPLFEHIDCKINGHMMLRGETGSGKSTLLKLLMGYDENYIGDIYFNDQELRTIHLESLYRHVGYVCQTPTFLHVSLYENFLCDDLEKIKGLLKAFKQEELIDLFHMTLDEDGAPLSLGQRQVVALIRMLCQDYDICLMDEAFSHMDAKLSSRVQKYLLTHDEGKIYIMVNHQSRTLKNGWNVITIDNSKKNMI